MSTNKSTFCILSEDGKKCTFPNDADEGGLWKSVQAEAPLPSENGSEIELKVSAAKITHFSVGVAPKMGDYETHAHYKAKGYMLRLDGDFFNGTQMRSMFDYTKMKNDQEYKVKLSISLGSIKISIDDEDMGYGAQGDGEINSESQFYLTISSLGKGEVEILSNEILNT